MRTALLFAVVLLHGLGQCSVAHAKPYKPYKSSYTKSRTSSGILPGVIGGAVAGSLVSSAAKAQQCAQTVAVPDGATSFGQVSCKSDGSTCSEWFKKLSFNEYVQKKTKKPLAQIYSMCYDQSKKQAHLYWKE